MNYLVVMCAIWLAVVSFPATSQVNEEELLDLLAGHVGANKIFHSEDVSIRPRNRNLNEDKGYYVLEGGSFVPVEIWSANVVGELMVYSQDTLSGEIRRMVSIDFFEGAARKLALMASLDLSSYRGRLRVWVVWREENKCYGNFFEAKIFTVH